MVLLLQHQSKGGHDVQDVGWRGGRPAPRVSARFGPSHQRVDGPPFSMPHTLRLWTPLSLAVVAVLMALDPSPTLAGRFESATRATRRGGTYQGWIKSMRGLGRRMLACLRPHLRSLIRDTGKRWETGGFVPLAVDGGKFDAPRTIANEALGLAGKRGCGPQLLACVVLHLRTGLLWDWRLDGARGSERHLLLRMIRSLPRRALLIMDAGFVGLGFLRTLHDRRVSFIVRVGENVTLTMLGGGLVRLARRDRPGDEPLTLRLVRAGRLHLLTNVLDPARLSDAAALAHYRRRWDAEVFFRTIKQTMQRRKVRSASPANALAELDWAFVAATILGLLGVRAITARGADPSTLSMARALDAVRDDLRRNPGRSSAVRLRRRLAAALRDAYRRSGPKNAYQWPHKKQQRPPGIPRLIAA